MNPYETRGNAGKKGQPSDRGVLLLELRGGVVLDSEGTKTLRDVISATRKAA